MAAVHQVRVVTLGADLGPSNVFQLNDAVTGVLQDDVLEFPGIRQASYDPQGHLEILLGIGGRAPQLSGGDFDVLLLQGGDHVGGGQLARGELARVKPDPHGVLALTKDDHVAHAGHALQRVLDVNVEVVRDVLVGEAVVGRIEARGKHEVRICLGDGDTGVLNFLGKTALRGGHAVLHVHRGDVQVVAGAEDHIDAAGAVVGAGRGDVVHALDAIDLLLQRNGDRGLHHLRIGAHVIAADVDLRRRQVGIEGNGQRRNAHGPRKNYEECADRGKNRPLNEKVNQTRSSSPAPLATAKSAAYPMVLASCLVGRAYRRSGTACRRQ